MKKIFTFAAIAFAAFAMASCDKAGKGGQNNDPAGDEAPARKVLLALPSEIDEETGEFVYGRKFRYNEDGTLAGIDEYGDWGSYILNVKREGNKLSLVEVNDGVEGNTAMEWTVNAKGYITQSVMGESTYTFEYDADDHLIKIYESYQGGAPELKSVWTWTDGNLTSWTRENYNDDGSAKVKAQTYTTDLNVGGIFTIYNDKLGELMKRWMLEAGFFGKPSKNLVETDKWTDSDTGATYVFATDDDDYVIRETKYWGTDPEGTTYFMWQAAE